MQKLTPEQMQHADDMSDEVVPALADTEYYFALVAHGNRKVLCILGEDNIWRPTSYDEMMKLM